MLHLLSHVAAPAGSATCSAGGATCETNLPVAGAGTAQVHEIMQIVFGIAAALAVLMIVIAGLRFITAQGNPQEVSKARSTIVYSLIGLIVAITAEAIVSLTLSKI